ncbi:MAG: hypothetical protein LC672_00750 [Acidobacteria bacterium]|nr:hypothetical protein [Acidobacteriota bacterium]
MRLTSEAGNGDGRRGVRLRAGSLPPERLLDHPRRGRHSLPDFTLHTFGVLLAPAFVAAMWWVVRAARSEGLDPDTYLARRARERLEGRRPRLTTSDGEDS